MFWLKFPSQIRGILVQDWFHYRDMVFTEHVLRSTSLNFTFKQDIVKYFKQLLIDVIDYQEALDKGYFVPD